MVIVVRSWILGVLVCGEGRAPGITVTKSARFDKLENMYFAVFCLYNLPTGLSHVTMQLIGWCYCI